jgi:hypothetical protein
MFPKNLDEESDDGSNADSDFSGDEGATPKDTGGAAKGKKKPAKSTKKAGEKPKKEKATKKDSSNEIKAPNGS